MKIGIVQLPPVPDCVFAMQSEEMALKGLFVWKSEPAVGVDVCEGGALVAVPEVVGAGVGGEVVGCP